MAESYLQHAEHYFRLIAAAQAAQHQAQFGSQRQPGEPADQDEDGDDDFDSLPDRFASPNERVAQAPQNQTPSHQSQPHQSQPYEQRGDRSYGDRQPYEARNSHAPNGSFGGDRPQQDRQNDRSRHSYADRQNGQERPYQNQDRPQSQDRPYQDRQYQDRQYQDRQSQDRANQGAGQPQAGASQGQREERASRDYDNRGVRHRRDDRPRDGQPARETRDPAPRQLVSEEQPSVGLPAFITAPTRAPAMDVAETEQPTVTAAESPATAPDASDEAGFHMRPRRRRRPKPEFAGADEGARDKEPVAPQGDDGNA